MVLQWRIQQIRSVYLVGGADLTGPQKWCQARIAKRHWPELGNDHIRRVPEVHGYLDGRRAGRNRQGQARSKSHSELVSGNPWNSLSIHISGVWKRNCYLQSDFPTNRSYCKGGPCFD